MRLRIKGTKAEHADSERIKHVIRRFLKACKAWHEANARATRVLENCMRIVIARRRMAKRAEERRVERRGRVIGAVEGSVRHSAVLEFGAVVALVRAGLERRGHPVLGRRVRRAAGDEGVPLDEQRGDVRGVGGDGLGALGNGSACALWVEEDAGGDAGAVLLREQQ